ncbi:hypothetical protein GCM10008967_01920 [Bacillus carboniphilus]|uniref:Capsule synthesis protein CapA domain-containing protein n=1 Tax=Bacillus carboniphilus TaxID=86663 RepID=A0ABN0VQZ8_9BACI
MKNITILLCVLLLLFTGLLTYHWFTRSDEAVASKLYPIAEHVTSTYVHHEREYETSLTLGAIGDILIHDWVYEDARERATDGTYDFHPMLEQVAPLLREPDLLLANQESVLGGAELPVSNYPLFNSPTEVGDALIEAGVDIVSTANNHSIDKGEKGVQASIRYYESTGLPYVGSYKSFEDQSELRVLEKNKVAVAYLSYTASTNGIPVPTGKEYLVNVVDREAISEEIQRAKEAADIVVMSIHWGQEYIRYPNSYQEDLASFLISEGVDIIFGHHPHVLQPIEWIESENGNKGLVVYSLGNFLSGQMWDYKDIGGLVEVDISKSFKEGQVHTEITDVRFHPTYVYSKHLRSYLVVPLQDAEAYGVSNAVALNQEILEHMLPQ